MILSIGKNKELGFTFVELMTAVAILGIGIVAIYRFLLSAMDYQSQLTARLFAGQLLDHEIAVLERITAAQGEFPSAANGKVIEAELNYRKIPFVFTLQPASVHGIEYMFAAQAAVSWPHAGRVMTVKRSLYLANPYPKETKGVSK